VANVKNKRKQEKEWGGTLYCSRTPGEAELKEFVYKQKRQEGQEKARRKTIGKRSTALRRMGT